MAATAASVGVAGAGMRPRHVPIRTCVACRTSGGKRGLLRVVRLADGGGLQVDPTGKRSGRGAYVCRTSECVTLALKQRKLERSLKMPVPDSLATALHASVANTSESAESLETGQAGTH